MKALRIMIAAAIPVLAVVTMAAPALASSGSHARTVATVNHRVRHIGSCRAVGDFAVCVASGNAIRPHRIRSHTSASPNQRVDVTWSMVCSRGTGVGQRSGSFHGFTPVNRILRHSFRHPDSCSVVAEAQLAHSGHIHEWLTYRR